MTDDNTTAAKLRALALAKARELERLLQQLAELPEFGPGSCPEMALIPLDDVLGYLEPLATDGQTGGRRSRRSARSW
jgi:hypothetical protein